MRCGATLLSEGTRLQSRSVGLKSQPHLLKCPRNLAVVRYAMALRRGKSYHKEKTC